MVVTEYWLCFCETFTTKHRDIPGTKTLFNSCKWASKVIAYEFWSLRTLVGYLCCCVFVFMKDIDQETSKSVLNIPYFEMSFVRHATELEYMRCTREWFRINFFRRRHSQLVSELFASSIQLILPSIWGGDMGKRCRFGGASACEKGYSSAGAILSSLLYHHQSSDLYIWQHWRTRIIWKFPFAPRPRYQHSYVVYISQSC